MNCRHHFILFLAALFGVRAASPVSAADVSGIFRITTGTSHTVSQFRQMAVPKGGEFELARFSGAGKISYFYLTDDTVGRWYPGLVLKIYWDQETVPSIAVPLADFFGAIGGRSVDYQSTAMQINHACFACYLPMPYSDGARIVLANDGERDYSQKVAYGVDAETDSAFLAEKSRLHCAWHRSNPVTNGLHTILEVQGGGQYVGNFLQVASKETNIWFGEGDTMFELDSRSFSHSPGTEDEYGSCWEDPHWRTFSSAYCGHVLNESGVNRMYRWYVANPVRFQHALTVKIQNQHDNGTPTTGDADDYISVAFWYQEGAHAAPVLPDFKARTATSFAGKP